jgi:methionine-S-sulfoxide reductase
MRADPHPRSSVIFLLVSCFVAAGCHSATVPDASPIPSASTGDSAATNPRVGTDPGSVGRGTPLHARPGNELAAFAAGCFWGVEDAFRKIPGVVATAVGYTGGRTEDPTYEQVCTHATGHAEAVLVEFDPSRVSYDRLVRAFFRIHDPTTLNRQGPDIGDQYRSAVFTFSDAQAQTVRTVAALAERDLGDRIVTEVRPIARFFKAEDYHQQYAEHTGHHGCPTGKLQGI